MKSKKVNSHDIKIDCFGNVTAVRFISKVEDHLSGARVTGYAG